MSLTFHYKLIILKQDVINEKLLMWKVASYYQSWLCSMKKNYISIFFFYLGGEEKWVILNWFRCLVEVDGLFDSEIHHGVVMDCLPCGLLTEHAQTGRGFEHVQLLLQILYLFLSRISKINKNIIVLKYTISGPHDHKLRNTCLKLNSSLLQMS